MKNKAYIIEEKLHHPNKACWVQYIHPIEVLQIHQPSWFKKTFFGGMNFKTTATVKCLLSGGTMLVFTEDIHYAEKYPQPVEIPYAK